MEERLGSEKNLVGIDLHRVANQDAFVQLLLLDELLHISSHSTVVVLGRMERRAMVSEILQGHVSIDLFKCSCFLVWDLKSFVL